MGNPHRLPPLDLARSVLSALPTRVASRRGRPRPRGFEGAAHQRDVGEGLREVAEQAPLLPDRHREVLLRRYGLRGEKPETHAQIGARLGVGEERSRQLEREALHRLRSLGDAWRLAA
jgi:DNA-directed RNA polymerase sigma subunit (sigma70/sigma32)